jgi:creatinine amidohydrolase
MRLAEATWPEVRALAARPGAVAILPTGSFEQHGPHLPLRTDADLADALAAMVAERLDAPIAVAPAVLPGLSEHHRGFAGTVSVPEVVFHGVLRAWVDGLAEAGVRRVAVFSAHGGNFAALGRFAASCRGAGIHVAAYDDLDAFTACMFSAARDAGLDPPETDIHAGLIETSMQLALGARVLAPDGVAGCVEAEAGWRERMTAEGIGALSASGVLGRPAGARATAGLVVLDALAGLLAGWMRERLGVPLRRRADAPGTELSQTPAPRRACGIT